MIYWNINVEKMQPNLTSPKRLKRPISATQAQKEKQDHVIDMHVALLLSNHHHRVSHLYWRQAPVNYYLLYSQPPPCGIIFEIDINFLPHSNLIHACATTVRISALWLRFVGADLQSCGLDILPLSRSQL